MERWQEIKYSWRNPIVLLVILLMILNWGLEAIKWRLLLLPIEKISLRTSFKAVLAGSSITMLTPNRIGEFGGRILFLKNTHRLKAISISILGSISQLFITFLFGTIGLVYFKFMEQNFFNSFSNDMINIVFLLSLIGIVLLLVCYFNFPVLSKLISKLPFWKNKITALAFIEKYSINVLVKVLLLSFFRYLVFIFQYILILKITHVEIKLDLCFWLLSIFYLTMALAPTIGFTELPIRAKTISLLIGIYSENYLGVQFAALGIWIINLVLPAIIGSIFIIRTKIIKDERT